MFNNQLTVKLLATLLGADPIELGTSSAELEATALTAIKASLIDPEPGYIHGSICVSPKFQINTQLFMDALRRANQTPTKLPTMIHSHSTETCEVWLFRKTYWLVATINNYSKSITFQQHCLDLTNPAPNVFVNANPQTLIDAPKDLCALFGIPIPAQLTLCAVRNLLRQFALDHYAMLGKQDSRFKFVTEYRNSKELDGEGLIALYDSPYLLCLLGGRYYPIPLDETGKWLDEPYVKSTSDLWFMFLDKLKQEGQTNRRYANLHHCILSLGNSSRWENTPDSYYRQAAVHIAL